MKRNSMVGLSAALLIGVGACGSGESLDNMPTVTTGAAACGKLAVPEFIVSRPLSPTVREGMLIKNIGECAEVHDEVTLQSLGRIAHNVHFIGLCITGPETGLRVDMVDVVNGHKRRYLGEVLLDDIAVRALNSGQFPPTLQDCA